MSTQTARTQDEIVARIEAIKDADFFGFKTGLLIRYLDFKHAKQYLKEGVAAEEYAQMVADVKPPAEEGADYLEFAVGKIRDERGISASRSVDKFAEWAWLDGQDDLAEQIDDEDNYGWYGDRAIRLYTDHYALIWPEAVAE